MYNKSLLTCPPEPPEPPEPPVPPVHDISNKFNRINGSLTIVNESIIFDNLGNFKKKNTNNNQIPTSTDLSGMSLWITDNGTFYKDIVSNFKFENKIHINGACSSRGLVLTSDKRLKTDIVNISDNDIINLMSLIPVSFNWKKDIKKKTYKHIFGFIAQDVKKTFPDMIYNGDKFLHLDYIQMVPLLLKKIHIMRNNKISQNKRIKLLEYKINNIKKQLNI